MNQTYNAKVNYLIHRIYNGSSLYTHNWQENSITTIYIHQNLRPSNWWPDSNIKMEPTSPTDLRRHTSGASLLPLLKPRTYAAYHTHKQEQVFSSRQNKLGYNLTAIFCKTIFYKMYQIYAWKVEFSSQKNKLQSCLIPVTKTWESISSVENVVYVRWHNLKSCRISSMTKKTTFILDK